MPCRYQETSSQEECETVGTKAIEGFFEKEYRSSQKEMLAIKSKVYEYKYKIDSLKQKLLSKEKEAYEMQQRFE